MSPLTVLASTSPTMSSRVSAPVTVLALTPARTPLIKASALTVLALMSVVAGTEMLIRALRLPLSWPRDIRPSHQFPFLSVRWLIFRVQPSQLTVRGCPATSCTSSRAVGESSWVTMSTRPATRPSLSLPTVSFSLPMSSTFGPSICHSCAIVAPLHPGRRRSFAIRAISRFEYSRYSALCRVCNPLASVMAAGDDWQVCAAIALQRAHLSRTSQRWTASAAEVQPAIPAAVQHQPGDQPIPGLAWVNAIAGRAQVRAVLLMTVQRPIAVDVGNTAASAHISLRRDHDLDPPVQFRIQRRRRPHRECGDPACGGVVQNVGEVESNARGRHVLRGVVVPHRDDQALLGTALPSWRTLGAPASEHVGGSLAANPQLVGRDVHIRVLGAPYHPRDPARALGIAVSGDVGVPDEHER